MIEVVSTEKVEFVKTPPTLPAYRPGNWFCGHCGHSLLRTKWLHVEEVVKKGFEDYACQNAACAVFQQTLRIPLDIHHFEKLYP